MPDATSREQEAGRALVLPFPERATARRMPRARRQDDDDLPLTHSR